MTRILSQTRIERPPEVVFAYVTAPGHWPEWHPSSLGVRGTLTSLEVGQEVIEAFRVAGRRGEVVWRCTLRQAPYNWVIEGQIVGRKMGGVISYTLRPQAGGTHFLREFRYPRPNLWFALLDPLILRPRVRAESEEALRRLRKRLEDGGPSHVG
jgi:uncharacterized protein YndB with AHSA1/START domain